MMVFAGTLEFAWVLGAAGSNKGLGWIEGFEFTWIFFFGVSPFSGGKTDKPQVNVKAIKQALKNRFYHTPCYNTYTWMNWRKVLQLLPSFLAKLQFWEWDTLTGKGEELKSWNNTQRLTGNKRHSWMALHSVIFNRNFEISPEDGGVWVYFKVSFTYKDRDNQRLFLPFPLHSNHSQQTI